MYKDEKRIIMRKKKHLRYLEMCKIVSSAFIISFIVTLT